MPTIKVQGQIYHQIGSLLPMPKWTLNSYKFILLATVKKESIKDAQFIKQ